MAAKKKTKTLRADGWKNALLGIGNTRDKRGGACVTPSIEMETRENQEALWRADDMAARCVEMIPDEMTRQGFSVQIDSDAADTGTSEKYDARILSGYRYTRDVTRSNTGERLHVFTHRDGTTMLRSVKLDAAFGGPPSPGAPFVPPPPPKAPPKPVNTADTAALKTASAAVARYEELEGPERILEALSAERGYGGSALVLGLDDGQELWKPLNLDNIRSFDWINMLTPRELQAVKYYGNALQPKYGRPEIYRVQADVNMSVDMTISSAPNTGRGVKPVLVTQEIHESRLIVFPGISVSRRHRLQRNGWGDSIFVRLYEILRDFAMSYHGTANLITDFAQAVFKMKGLAELLSANDDDTVVKRAQLIDMSRSIARAVILDADGEDFERKSTPVTGLSELLERFEHRLAAAADMPVSLMMGQSPAGLNASGDSDIRFFYDRMKSRQNRFLKPRLERLMRLVFLSKDGPTKGVEPEDWNIKFHPLWQASDLEQSTIRMNQSATDKNYVDMGALTPEEVAASRFGSGEWSPDTTIDNDARQELSDAHAEATDAHTSALADAAAQAFEKTTAPRPGPGEPPEVT